MQVVVFLFSFSGMDYDTGIGREWLVPNGIGGYASSTIIAANSRKYHGLLVSATDPPLGRRVLLAGIDETLRFGCESLELSVHKYPDTVYPQGFLHLASFRMENFPTFIYETSGLRVEKTVFYGAWCECRLYRVFCGEPRFYRMRDSPSPNGHQSRFSHHSPKRGL